jgi:hypothetical protein
VTTSVGKISTFTNRGSLGGTVTQATASARAVRTASDARFGGIATFTGGAAAGVFYDLPSLLALTEGEAFFVGIGDDPSAFVQSEVWAAFGTEAQNALLPYTTGAVFDNFGSTVRKSCGDPTPSLANPFLYNVYSANNDWAARVNGASFFSTATNTVSFRSNPRLFSNPNDAAAWFKGSCAHLFICGSKQSADARAAMEQWVKANCGVTAIT